MTTEQIRANAEGMPDQTTEMRELSGYRDLENTICELKDAAFLPVLLWEKLTTKDQYGQFNISLTSQQAQSFAFMIQNIADRAEELSRFWYDVNEGRAV